MATELWEYLSKLPGAGLEASSVPDAQIFEWGAEVSRVQIQANGRRFLVGRALKYRRVGLAYGEATAWLEAVASELGRAVRTLRSWMRIANAMEVGISAADEIGRKLPISILDRPWDEIPDALTKALGEEGGARVRKSSVPGLKACIGIFDARVKASATNRDELRSLRAAAMGFIDQIDQAVLALGEEPEVELGAVAGEHLSAVTWARSRRPMSSRATATSPASPAASV